MALCWPSLFLLLSLYSTHANAANITLSAELTNFVPVCAQDCFKSFLDINFPTSVCTNTPTLSCLCSHNSTTGYTVGEGAVQCIISEDSIGGCRGMDAKEEVVVDAYTMCNGQDDALPNTHGTITATLIVQTSMPSIVLIAPTPTTISNSSSVGSNLPGITSPVTTAPSTLSIQTASSSPSKITTINASKTAQAASETPSNGATLTKPQIIGITVASVGGSALAVGTLILFACWRRKKATQARDSDMLPFQQDPSLSTKYSYGFRGPTELSKKRRGPGGTANGVAAKIPPPVPPRIDTGTPNMFSRRSIRPDTIGLAISPETKEAVERRHSSKLLPDKPILTLKVPQPAVGKGGGAVKFSQPFQQPSAISRQSTTTQFEEDYDDSADTAVAASDDWGRGSTDQILNNGTGNWSTIRPVPPNSGGTPQFVISSSDWKPQDLNANKAASAQNSDYKVKPLVLSRTAGSFSQPRPIARNDSFSRPPRPAQLAIPTTHRPVTASSSIYSADTSLPPSDSGRTPNHLIPPRVSSSKSYKQPGPYDRQISTASSLTSFDTADSVPITFTQGYEPEPKTAGTDLSPVVESPASGKSPVSYPKIPGRLSRDYIRMVPPPPQPDFGAIFSSQSQGAAMKPWRVAEVNAQRERVRQAQGLGIQGQQPRGTPGPYPRRDYIAPSAAYNLPPSQPQLQPQLQPQPPPNSYQPNPNPLNQSSSRTSSLISQASNSSSLLAKRRGEQKAAQLKLMNEDDKKRQQAKWRVLKDGDIERAKMPGWRPQLAGGGGVFGYNGQVVERTDLPGTPGWIPKLTPTRRGDELFLSVQ